MLRTISPVVISDLRIRTCYKCYLRRLGTFLILLLLGGTAYASSSVSRRTLAVQKPDSTLYEATERQESDIRALEPAKPIARDVTAGEAHSYGLNLASGQYARILVAQRLIKVAISVFDVEGKKMFEASRFPIGDSEVVWLVADAAGSYRIVVTAPDKATPRGSYEISVKDVRAATEQDRSAFAAERLFEEALQLSMPSTAEACRRAIEKYKESIPLWRAANDKAWEASTLYVIAGLYIFMGDRQNAFDYSNRALPPAQEAAKDPDPEKRAIGVKTEVYALYTIGQAYNEFGDKKKALEFFDQALSLARASGDRPREGDTLYSMGKALVFIGDYPKALDVTTRARQIAAELGDRRKESGTLNNLCVISADSGDNKKAIDLCSQSLDVSRSLNDRLGIARTLNNMGNAYSNTGLFQKALDFYGQSLASYSADNPQSQAIELNNIGVTYAALGEHEKAIDYYNQSLAILQRVGDEYRAAISLTNVAAEYATMNDFKKAVDINLRVLAMRRAVHDAGGEANTLNKLANCYQHLGEKQVALDYYEKALALFRDAGHRRLLAETLDNVGVFYREAGDPDKAMKYFTDALQLSRPIGERRGEARILSDIALLERDRGNLTEAKGRIEEALAAVESLRVNVKSYQLRASFLALVRRYYEIEIDVLMRLHKQRPSAGFDAAALHASEQSRARSLLELLAEANAEIRRDVDSALLERERALRQMISEKADRQMRLLDSKKTEDQATTAAREIDNLANEYDQVQAQIRDKSPRYAALTQPTPLAVKQIQSEVLDPETVLLEYALGEERSYLWAVTPTSIQSFELPKRVEIESAARKAYEMLAARNLTVGAETPEQKRLRIARADADYPKASAALSQMLLGPVASELRDKRLAIVGEGALQYLPFAALPEPSASGTEGSSNSPSGAGAGDSSIAFNRPPLVVGHEIVSLPSASVLAVLRKERTARKTAENTVAVLADPVFAAEDTRVRMAVGATKTPADDSSPSAEIKRSAAESGLPALERLRFSRQEADQVMRFASEGKKFEALDFAANRATATNPELGHYSILHLATHALINNQHPELSGVVLSLVDERGRPENGFLRLYDIYNLNLEADLVVLSACQTALGKDIKGEGLVGLTRGFMYAGAQRVVASLWQIDDRATAVLMGRFYEALLLQRLRPAAALRAAQTSMWRDKRWQAPYYWAPFTLQGEWK